MCTSGAQMQGRDRIRQLEERRRCRINCESDLALCSPSDSQLLGASTPLNDLGATLGHRPRLMCTTGAQIEGRRDSRPTGGEALLQIAVDDDVDVFVEEADHVLD